jgi:RNA polymerase sigma factor (sigma-70 family)
LFGLRTPAPALSGRFVYSAAMAGSESKLTRELFEQAAAGDEAAQTVVYEECLSVIRKAVKHRQQSGAPTRDDPQDFVQDIAIHLLAELRKHSWKNEDSFFAWVKQVSHAKLIDAHRRSRAAKRDVSRETRFDSEDDLPRKGGDGVETTVDKIRLREELEGFLAQLKENYAMALRMEVEGFTHAEIAKELGLPSEDAARKLLKRARAKLEKLKKSGKR